MKSQPIVRLVGEEILFYLGSSGAVNSGGGCGGRSGTSTSGGSGVVILRMPTSGYSGFTTGSPNVTTDGTDTILEYTGSGTYVG